jgi:hypothetical protein
MVHVADSVSSVGVKILLPLVAIVLPRLSLSHAAEATKTGKTPTETEEHVNDLRQLSSLSSNNPRMFRKSTELLITFDPLFLNRPVSFSIAIV